MKNNFSQVSKYLIYLFPIAVFFLGVFLVGFLQVFDRIAYEKNLKKDLIENAPNFVREKMHFITEFTQHGVLIIHSVASSEFAKTFFQTGDYSDLKALMKAAIYSEKEIMQFRFIATNGQELIRFDRVNDNSVQEVVETALQNKLHRDYVYLNIEKPSSVWFSNLDLNQENGVIETPFKPTFRIVLPVWNENKFQGMFVVNFFAQNLLEHLFLKNDDYDIKIVDNEEYIFFSHDQNESFSRYRDPSFKATKDYIYKIELKAPFANKLFMNLYLNEEALLKRFNQERAHILKVSLYILGVTLLIAILIFFTMKNSKLKIDFIEKQLDLQNKLLQQQKQHEIMNDVLDTNVISSTTDLKGKITSVSQAFCKISGFSQEELLGKQHNIVRHEDMPKVFYENLWQTIQSGRIWQGKIKNKRKDGSVYWVDAIINPIFDDNGNKIGYSAIRHDITDQMLVVEKEKELIQAHQELKLLNESLENKVQDQVEKITHQEKILIQQSKMASMGEMIANIAHQWKQPLSMLSLAVLAVSKKYEKGLLSQEYMHEFVSDSQKFIEKMSATISDFSDFFSPNKSKVEFDILSSIYDVLELFKSQLDANDIRISMQNSSSEQIRYVGSKNEFEQVFMNLIKNSIDAHLEKNVDGKYIEIEVVKMNEVVKVYCRDNAGEIPPETLQRVFEPYFTTKFKSDGVGIGLYMCKMIVEKTFHGDITLKNNGYETIVKISLPINERQISS